MATPNNQADKDTATDLADRVDLGLTLACVLYWAAVIYYATFNPIPRSQFGILFLGGSLIVYMGFEAVESIERNRWLDVGMLVALSLVTIVTTLYIGYLEFEALYYTRIGYQTQLDYAIALGILGTVTYLTYRSFGLPFFGVLIFVLIYGFFGYLFPGILSHAGLTTERLVQRTVLDIDGIYGNLTRLMATWIAIFLLYSGLMQGYGAFDLILRGAVRTAKYIKSGVAQSAVIGSLIIGSINGSAAANTGITGSMTIPLMKESGMKPESAGATEAVASAGGQIMPPVMGAAAFLMASLLNRPFPDILVAALIPALIFYTSVVFAVHFTAIQELDNVDPTELVGESKPTSEVAVQALRFFIPFAALIYFLGIRQFQIMTAGLLTILTMFVTGITFPMIQERSMARLRETLRSTVEGFKLGAKAAVPIAIVIAAINAVVDVLVTTGMPSKLSLAIIGLSGGVMAFAVILAMITCIILGMGMPTVAAYLLVALLIAPVLTGDFGVPKIAAHFFVFYSAILSALTPPIAVGIVIGCGIAEADFWKTADRALRIAAPLFVLPFMFVYHPEVVSSDVGVRTTISAIMGLSGALWMVYALNNPFNELTWAATKTVKLLYFILGVGAMVMPSNTVRIGCIIGAGAVYVFQNFTPVKFRRRYSE